MYYVWLEPNWNDFCVISLRFEWKGIENMTLFNTIWVMKFLLFVLALGPISVSVSQSRQASRKCKISSFNFYYTYVSTSVQTIKMQKFPFCHKGAVVFGWYQLLPLIKKHPNPSWQCTHCQFSPICIWFDFFTKSIWKI